MNNIYGNTVIIIMQNPSAGKIHDLFVNEGENIVNDHIAFRTLDFPEIDVDVLAKPFVSNGYMLKESIILRKNTSLLNILNSKELTMHHEFL